jgi:CheY-like chemotaxis protein/HPt (histidine-containing phosphotransfer) domain-containing protein
MKLFFVVLFFKDIDMTNHQNQHDPSDSSKKQIHILLAEDDVLNQKFLTFFLNKNGYLVDWVKNGYEVLSALEKHTYDIILMDIHMPEMDGLTTTKKIRNDDSKPFQQIPIIALTAHTIRGHQKKFIKAGLNAYVSKPVDFNILVTTIEKILASKKDIQTKTKPDIDKKQITGHYKDDIHYLIETNQDDPDYLHEILKSFPIDAENRLNNIKTAIINNDTKAIAIAAHKFIALFSCIFIDSASKTSHDLQAAAKNNEIDQCKQIFEQLAQLMKEIIQYIESINQKDKA